MIFFAVNFVSLVIGFSVGPLAAAGELFSVSVELKRSAVALEMLIGDDCLCDPAAAMTPAGNTLVIRDLKSCAKDLKILAVNWQNEVDWVVTSIPGTPEKIRSVRNALEKKLGKAPNGQLRFLSDSPVLHCLVFATPEPQPVFADGGQEKGEGEGSSVGIKRKGQPFSEFFEKSRSEQGLYIEPGRASMPNAAPST